MSHGKGWLIALLLLAGCRSKAPAPAGVEAYGLVESTVDRPTLQAAVLRANLVLGPSAAVRLAPEWSGAETAHPVLVYAVTTQGLSKREAMTSYQRCHCVIAQIGRVTEWLKEQTGTGSGLLAIDLRDVLAYMLLHEAGHIAHGDLDTSNAFDGSDEGQFNLQSTAQKERENAADHFAADTIASGIQEKGTDRGLASARLSMVLAQLSWNLAEHRILDNFGGTEANLSSLFKDAGLSHPNLEWRILVVNDLISHSSTSHQLLSDFEEHRHHEPSILFQAPKP